MRADSYKLSSDYTCAIWSVHAHTHMHTHIHKHTYMHTYIHTQTHMHAYTYTSTIHAYTNAHAYKHTYIYTHASKTFRSLADNLRKHLLLAKLCTKLLEVTHIIEKSISDKDKLSLEVLCSVIGHMQLNFLKN